MLNLIHKQLSVTGMSVKHKLICCYCTLPRTNYNKMVFNGGKEYLLLDELIITKTGKITN